MSNETEMKKMKRMIIVGSSKACSLKLESGCCQGIPSWNFDLPGLEDLFQQVEDSFELDTRVGQTALNIKSQTASTANRKGRQPSQNGTQAAYPHPELNAWLYETMDKHRPYGPTGR